MSGAILWPEQGERQTPLEAAAQALMGLHEMVERNQSDLDTTGVGRELDQIQCADLPSGLWPLLPEAGKLGQRIHDELLRFSLLLRQRESNEATQFVPLVRELLGLARACAAILLEAAPTIEEEAFARDRAISELQAGSAVIASNGAVIAAALPEEGAAA